MVERSEYALYAFHNELHAAEYEEMLVAVLASVVDALRIDIVSVAWHPTMMFHAAAYKHLPRVEHNTLEGLRNKVICTANVAELLARFAVAASW